MYTVGYMVHLYNYTIWIPVGVLHQGQPCSSCRAWMAPPDVSTCAPWCSNWRSGSTRRRWGFGAAITTRGKTKKNGDL